MLENDGDQTDDQKLKSLSMIIAKLWICFALGSMHRIPEVAFKALEVLFLMKSNDFKFCQLFRVAFTNAI